METQFGSPFSFSALSIDPTHWRTLFAQGKHDELCRAILQCLRALTTSRLPAITPADQPHIDALCELLLTALAQPNFRIAEALAADLVIVSISLSSLVALSRFKNTDRFLHAVSTQPMNFVRLLTLYSARNTLTFDRAAVFQTSPALASLWYVQFSQSFHGGLASETVLNNLRAHFEFPATALHPTINMPEAFFGSTYVDGRCDRLIKPHINRAAKSRFNLQPPALPSAPNPTKIAVVSTLWRANHSVYRIYADLFRALKPKYHLTFFQIGRYGQQKTDLFDDVQILETNHGFPVLEPPHPLLNHDFQMIIYPDVGMANESIVLANQRLAPIQVALLGHSVSTYGADIDYFISGAEVEIADRPEQNYSERLVLLPGMGCSHNRPHFQPSAAPPPLSTDRIVISMPCNSHKFNAPFVATLKKLRAACTRSILVRIFTGSHSALTADLHLFRQNVAAALGDDAVDVVPNIPYADYMAALEQSHFCLDTHHFGGCNTVSDALYVRTPMLCWQGDKWYNRIGPAMLRRAGLPELAATSEAEYLATAHRLIHDDAWRDELRTRLQHADLNRALYAADDAPHFLHAVDHLIQNRAHLQTTQDRSPIFIPTQNP